MSLESECAVLEKLTKARSAVKRKYHLLRRDRLEAKKVIDESFKPLREPLQKLVKLKKETRGWRDIGNLVDTDQENLMNYDKVPSQLLAPLLPSEDVNVRPQQQQQGQPIILDKNSSNMQKFSNKGDTNNHFHN